MTQFKVGDRVRVVNALDPEDYMDGDAGTVYSLNVGDGICIDFDHKPDNNKDYPVYPEELELIPTADQVIDEHVIPAILETVEDEQSRGEIEDEENRVFNALNQERR